MAGVLLLFYKMVMTRTPFIIKPGHKTGLGPLVRSKRQQCD